MAKDIDRQVGEYFGVRPEPRVRDVPVLSLNERVAVQLSDGREVYVSIPYDPLGRKLNWSRVIEMAQAHPETKLFLWDGEDLRLL